MPTVVNCGGSSTKPETLNPKPEILNPQRLLAYARSVAHFPTALKEFDWRNKYFLDLTRARAAKGLPDLTPMHTDLLSKPSTLNSQLETLNPQLEILIWKPSS